MYNLMLTVAGSHLYGTNTPESDIDYRGVCLPPIESIIGLQNFEQTTQLEGYVSDDVIIYSLDKFIRLALQNNPNIIELLFAGDSVIFNESILISSEQWKELVGLKGYILSDTIRKTFIEYAKSQLHKMKRHHNWMKSTPKKPEPEDYGMRLNSDGGADWTSRNRKNQYDNMLKNFQDYETWRKNRNPKMASLEESYGYDTKAAGHLYRLMFEAKELLETGWLTLPLKDDYLEKVLLVMNGGKTYEEVLDDADKYFGDVENFPSVLRKKPKVDVIEEYLIKTYYKYLKNEIRI